MSKNDVNDLNTESAKFGDKRVDARTRAIFLDRDGTLIIDKVYLNDPKQIVYLPNVFSALQLLRDAGYIFVVVTNQSGVARGIVDIKNLDLIHDLIRAEFAANGVEILDFLYAPYSVESNHHMRKPNPGMLEAAAELYKVDLSQSWMIGDRMTDVEAGHRAGCKTVLLAGVETPESSAFREPEIFVDDLLLAAQHILSISK